MGSACDIGICPWTCVRVYMQVGRWSGLGDLLLADGPWPGQSTVHVQPPLQARSIVQLRE